MANRIHSKQMRIGLYKQPKASNHWDAYGTTSTAYQTLFYEPTSIRITSGSTTGYAMGTRIGTSSGIMKEVNRTVVDKFGTLPRVAFSGIATKKTLHSHLAAAFQGVTESAISPFQKFFVPADTVVDFEDNEGHLYTIAGHTVSGDGFILRNAMLDNLTVSVNPLAASPDNTLQISGEWVGTEILFDQTFSGSWLADSLSFYGGGGSTNNFGDQLYMTLDGEAFNDLCYSSLSITMSNNVTTDCKGVGGTPNNFLLAPTLTCEVNMPYNDATYVLMGNIQTTVMNYLSLGNGTAATVDGGLQLTLEDLRLTNDPLSDENNYKRLVAQFEALRPNASWGGGGSSVFELSDAVDAGY